MGKVNDTKKTTPANDYVIMMALLSVGKTTKAIDAKWKFYVLYMLKKIRNLLATIVSGVTALLLYLLVTFVIDNSNDWEHIADRFAAIAITLVIMWAINKKTKMNKEIK